MTTARQQASQAAVKRVEHSDVWWIRDVVENAAEDASDVWEPIVRRLLAAMPTDHLKLNDPWYSCETVPRNGEPLSDVCDCGAAARANLVQEIKEMLDGNG